MCGAALTALDFAEALGIEAEFWLNLEVNYALDLARSRRIAQGAKNQHRASAKVGKHRRPIARPSSRIAAAKVAKKGLRRGAKA